MLAGVKEQGSWRSVRGRAFIKLHVRRERLDALLQNAVELAPFLGRVHARRKGDGCPMIEIEL